MTTREDKHPAVLFAGGGTGGHLFPALAIHEQLPEHTPVHYACSNRPLDSRILTDANADFTPLPAAPPALRPDRALRFASGWWRSASVTRRIIRELRDAADRVVMCTLGGFVAPPAVRAARAERVPVLMINLDAVPGAANRFIAGQVTDILTAVPVKDRDWPVVPPVVRRAFTRAIDPADARRGYHLDPDLHTLLITGGSQGARSVGGFALAVATANPDAFHGWQVLHQCGAHDEPSEIASRWNALGIRAEVHPFLSDMPGAWAAATLHLGRCGAGTVAEAAATRTPSVFMPYPWHKDQHQKLNALPLVDASAAACIDDRIDPDANARDHAQTLLDLIQDEATREAMSRALRALPEPNGARQIAHRLAQLA